MPVLVHIKNIPSSTNKHTMNIRSASYTNMSK